MSRCLLVLSLVLLAAPPLAAQGFVGADRCLKCHKKLAGPAWKLHRESAAQLDPARKPNAARYAAATGGSPQAEACRRCHAPDAAAAPPTVSCETCHGPGKGYLDPHQERPFYDGASLMGLVMLHNQAGRIAQECTRCHVLTAEHKAIADLGHPTGDDFRMGAAFEKIKHWPSGAEKDVRVRSYGAGFLAELDKAGAPQIQKALKGQRAPAPAVGAAQTASPTRAVPAGAAPRPAPPSGGVLASLLDDLQREGVDVRAPRVADERAAEFQPASPPPAPAPAADPSPPPARAAAKASDIFELRGLAAARLQELLKRRAKLDIKAPAPPGRFPVPDGELLALQDEVLALALEALRRKEP